MSDEAATREVDDPKPDQGDVTLGREFVGDYPLPEPAHTDTAKPDGEPDGD